MSRTFRRKNSQWNFQWHLQDTVWEKSKYGGIFQRDILIEKHSKEYKKRWHNYHDDRNQNRQQGVPHWYTNLYFERSFRQQHKREIKKYLSCTDYEDMGPCFKHSIGYWWY